MLTCYKKLTDDNLTAGGIGQGGGLYWQEAVGVLLQREIARLLDCPLHQHWRPHGRDSFDRQPYTPPDGNFDLAYLQLFEIPERRPADWVYTILSDYIGMEAVLEDFLAQVRPDLVISFQYPLDPPETIPGLLQLGRLPNLVEQCRRHGCRIVYLPWFNVENFRYDGAKVWTGMCTGKMSGTYPHRDAIYRYLESLQRPDIVLSGNPHGSTFRLSDVEYREALGTTKYYLSGGIYDIQIPPKYYEVCNHGAALISHDMPMMAASGFLPGETYVQIESLDEISDVLASEQWRTIGIAGQHMVHRRHSLAARARDIVNIYREMTGNHHGEHIETGNS